MNSDPKVSIIIPTYNYARFIGDALESVRRQSTQDYEIWVMDDGSTDNTASVVEALKKNFSGKLNYVRNDKNKGVYAIRNQAIRAAKGRFIAFLDADDLWMDSHLEDLTRYLEAHPEDLMVYANARFFYDGDGKDLGTQFGPGSSKTPRIGACAAELFTEGNFIPFMTTLLRREAFNRVGLFDESFKVGGDYDLFMRIACESRIGFVDKVLARVRRHDKNLSFLSRLQAATQLRILKKALRYFSKKGIRITNKNVRCRRAQLYYELGAALALEGNKVRSRKFLCRSFSLEPNPFKRKILAYFFLSFLPGTGSMKAWRTSWHVLREKKGIKNR